MRNGNEALQALIEMVPDRIREMSEETMSVRVFGKWSRREILGHLCDSAVNNQARFIRAQYEQPLAVPGYDQADWVRLQGYHDMDTEELLEMWTVLNSHLRRIISKIPCESMEALTCQVGSGAPVTLAQLLEQYLAHQSHHLEQIFE